MDQNSTSSLELISVPLTAGEPRTLYLTGQYFELIDAVNPVDVVLSDAYGSQRGLMRQAEASFFLKSTPFKVVQLTSATTQVVRFGYGSGEGGTRRSAGQVTIAGTVAVTGPLTDAQLRAAPVPVRVDQEPGASWSSTATLVANTPLTVFLPAANLNGAIIHAMESFDAGAGSNPQVFIAKASAPVSVTDGLIVAQASITAATTAPLVAMAINRHLPVRIPAGLGLYFIATSGGSVGVLRSARYTLL